MPLTGLSASLLLQEDTKRKAGNKDSRKDHFFQGLDSAFQGDKFPLQICIRESYHRTQFRLDFNKTVFHLLFDVEDLLCHVLDPFSQALHSILQSTTTMPAPFLGSDEGVSLSSLMS